MDLLSWTFAKTKTYDENKPLYIDAADPSRSLSANETRVLVRQLISGFKHHGLTKSDAVCVVSFNDIHYTAIYLSIIGAGGCFTGVNPGYTTRELSHHIRTTKAKFLLTELKALPEALKAAAECGVPKSCIFVLNYRDEDIPGLDQIQSWKALVGHGENDWTGTENAGEVTAVYASTSGTSGLPKAAIITHEYLVSQAEFQETLATATDNVSQLIALPPFHVFTMPVQHGLPLRRGTPTYIMPRFEDNLFVEVIDRFKITQIVTVPPILKGLTKASQCHLKSLRRIFVGGSPANSSMQEQLYSKLHTEAKIIQVYGMTEVGWATCWMKSTKDASGSVGQPLPCTRLRVVLGGKEIAQEGTTGEIEIHCPSPMKGYLGNKDATAQAFTDDGWVCTGDIGYVKNGNWYVIDRTKDLIKVRGWQVSPAEIEATLLEHPDIIDAGVIGVPAEDGCGEVPFAYVIPSADGILDQKAIQKFLRVRLARYKNVGAVEFVARIPRNPTGKVLRRILRDNRDHTRTNLARIAEKEYASAIKYIDQCHKRKRDLEGGGEEQKPSNLAAINKAGPPPAKKALLGMF